MHGLERLPIPLEGYVCVVPKEDQNSHKNSHVQSWDPPLAGLWQ